MLPLLEGISLVGELRFPHATRSALPPCQKKKKASLTRKKAEMEYAIKI